MARLQPIENTPLQGVKQKSGYRKSVGKPGRLQSG